MTTRFSDVFHATYHLAWKTLRRLGVPECSADDAAQEVFLVVAKKLDTIEPGRERSFVYGTARRVASEHRRALSRSPAHESDDSLDMRFDPRSSPEELAAAREQRAAVERAFRAMSREEREVFMLSEIEGLSKSEVARTLGIAEGTVASRLRRARRTIGGASPIVILGWWNQKWTLAKLSLGLVFASVVVALVVPHTETPTMTAEPVVVAIAPVAVPAAPRSEPALPSIPVESLPSAKAPKPTPEDPLALELRTIGLARDAIARGDREAAERALDAYDRGPGRALGPEAARLRDRCGEL